VVEAQTIVVALEPMEDQVVVQVEMVINLVDQVIHLQ
jgi:hypothetical protein